MISNCCGAHMPNADESDLCPDCLEHCEAEETEDEREEQFTNSNFQGCIW